MNAKLIKKINHRAIEIFIEWLRDQISEKEGAKINRSNVKDFIPKQQYYYNKGYRLSAASPKGIRKKIKKKIKRGAVLSDMTKETVLDRL
jgi:hypothetical protein|tara:strand:- start:777 stop:1046 length:270 start_codon:yes stop_codon:yes gene_type:complete